MPFNPTLPADHSPIVAAELRNQLNALKALMDAQAAQIAPLVPVLARDNNGVWTLDYRQSPPQYWSIWARFDTHPDWFAWNDLAFAAFPAGDADLRPPGAWWEVKVAGENDQGAPCTPFSNVVAYGNVPDV